LKQQDESVELQKDSEIALKHLEDSHRVKEKDYKYDIRSLSKMKKEQEVLQNDFIIALRKENLKKIHELKNEYELKENQMRTHFREKMRELQTNMEEKRKKILNDIYEKKTKEIKELTEKHSNIFNSMKNYYGELNKKNLNKLKELSKTYSDGLDKQSKLKVLLVNRNKMKSDIEEPWKKNEKLIAEKAKEEELCKSRFKELSGLNTDYSKLKEDLLDKEYKYEVTFQKIKYLEKEKGYFVNKYKDILHDVEQKAGLKNIILEKKLETIDDNLEIKEVQLKEVLKKTSVNPNTLANINNTLEEVESMKGELIHQLEEELKKIKEAHINMLKTFEAKMAELDIPTEEMGFEPLVPYDPNEKPGDQSSA